MQFWYYEIYGLTLRRIFKQAQEIGPTRITHTAYTSYS